MTTSLVSADFDGGSIAQPYPWSDIGVPDWTVFLRPLAELVFAAHPDAVWSAAPIPDDHRGF